MPLPKVFCVQVFDELLLRFFFFFFFFFFRLFLVIFVVCFASGQVTLVVGGIKPESQITNQQLQQIFSPFGAVVTAYINRERKTNVASPFLFSRNDFLVSFSL